MMMHTQTQSESITSFAVEAGKNKLYILITKPLKRLAALAGPLPDIVLEWVWSLAPLPRCRYS